MYSVFYYFYVNSFSPFLLFGWFVFIYIQIYQFFDHLWPDHSSIRDLHLYLYFWYLLISFDSFCLDFLLYLHYLSAFVYCINYSFFKCLLHNSNILPFMSVTFHWYLLNGYHMSQSLLSSFLVFVWHEFLGTLEVQIS